jgi:hypothetical protein
VAFWRRIWAESSELRGVSVAYRSNPSDRFADFALGLGQAILAGNRPFDKIRLAHGGDATGRSHERRSRPSVWFSHQNHPLAPIAPRD